MSTTAKWFIAAAIIIVASIVTFAIVMSINNWDFSKLETVNFETNRHDLTEKVNSISIETDTADIVFLPSDDGACHIVCYESTKEKHSVSVSDGTLNIKSTDDRKWYDHIQISFRSPKITVYLPEGEYASLFIKESTGNIDLSNSFRFGSIDISCTTGDIKTQASSAGLVKIRTTTGKICVEELTAGALDLSVTTGNITVSSVTCSEDIMLKVSTGKTVLSNVTCKNLRSEGVTGDLTLTDTVASGNFDLKRTTGDITFKGADAAEIKASTSTGDVTGSLRTEKIFFPSTSTGRIECPKSTNGGKCEISTGTGNIIIEIG